MGSAVFFFFFCLNRHVVLGDKILCSHGVHSHAALPTAELHLKTLVLLSLPRSLPKQLETREKSRGGGGSFCLSFSCSFSTCPFPSVTFSSLLLFPAPSLPPLPLCIGGAKHSWQMFLPHFTFLGLTGSHMLVAQPLSLSLSLPPLSHR